MSLYLGQLLKFIADEQYGTAPEAKQYSAGAYISSSIKPTATGNWVFAGWYKDEEYIKAWDFNKDTVTGDITLYAKFEELTCLRIVKNLQQFRSCRQQPLKLSVINGCSISAQILIRLHVLLQIYLHLNAHMIGLTASAIPEHS